MRTEFYDFNSRRRKDDNPYITILPLASDISIHVVARTTTDCLAETMIRVSISIHVVARTTTAVKQAVLTIAKISIHVVARTTTHPFARFIRF